MHQITITMSPTTLSSLRGMGYALYVMRAFNTTNAAGKPLVWLATTTFLVNTVIECDIGYEAYVSLSQEMSFGTVVSMSTAPVKLGQTATFDAQGQSTVADGGNPDGVTLVNAGNMAFTSGLAAGAGGPVTPLIAEPLYGLGENIVVPLEQFLLTFSTQGIAPGTLIVHAMSQSLLVDMTNATERSVSFDINEGWSAGGAPWATTVRAGAELAPLLVHQVPMLRRRA